MFPVRKRFIMLFMLTNLQISRQEDRGFERQLPSLTPVTPQEKSEPGVCEDPNRTNADGS